MNERLLRQYLEFFRELGVETIRAEPKRLDAAGERSGPPRADRAVPKPSANTAGARRPTSPSEAGPGVDARVAGQPPRATGAPDSLAGMRQVREDLGDCVRCKLHRTRTQIVFGTGNVNADLMFVGEAPGADEDLQGQPFVGRAGQLLTRIIEAIGLTREQVYIANIIKCRPPENRNPDPDEVLSCSPYVLRQIAVVRPRVICALGKFAAQTLLNTQAPIGQLRGRFVDGLGARIMPTFHPSYLLRNPSAKREVWEDMKAIRSYLESP